MWWESRVTAIVLGIYDTRFLLKTYVLGDDGLLFVNRSRIKKAPLYDAEWAWEEFSELLDCLLQGSGRWDFISSSPKVVPLSWYVWILWNRIQDAAVESILPVMCDALQNVEWWTYPVKIRIDYKMEDCTIGSVLCPRRDCLVVYAEFLSGMFEKSLMRFNGQRGGKFWREKAMHAQIISLQAYHKLHFRYGTFR